MWLIFVAVGCGFLIAILYDVYWLLAAHRPRPYWLNLLQDLLFWLIVFFLIAALWLKLTGGMMRLSVFLWFLLGGLTGRVGLSRRLRRLRPQQKLPPQPSRLTPEPTPQQAEAVATPLAKEQNPRMQQLKALPEQAMLNIGLGFWQGLAFLGREASLGKTWLSERLPKRKAEPEPEDPEADEIGEAQPPDGAAAETEDNQEQEAGEQALRPLDDGPWILLKPQRRFGLPRSFPKRWR